MQLKSIGEVSNAIIKFNNLVSSGSRGNLLFAESIKTLTTEQKIAVVAQSTLTEKEKIGVLATAGLTSEELKNVTATNALSASEEVATATTSNLGLAFQGLAAKIGISTTALGLLTAGIAAVAASVLIWKNYQEQLNEAVQASTESGAEFRETTNSITEQIEKVKELRSKLADSNTTEAEASSIKQELLGIQDSLVDKYGKEAEKINLVNGKLEDQISLLQGLSKEKANAYLNDSENLKGFEESKKQLNKVRRFNLATVTDENILDVAREFEDRGIELEGTYSGTTIKINADAEEAKEVIEDINERLRELQNESDEETSKAIDKFLKSSSEAYSKADEIVATHKQNYLDGLYAKMYSNGNDSGSPADVYEQYTDAINEYNEALKTGEGIDKAKKKYESVKDSVSSVEKEYKDFIPLFEELESLLDKDAIDLQNFTDKLSEGSSSKIKKYADEIKSLDLSSDDLRAFNPNDDMEEKGEKTFNKLSKEAEKYGLTIDELISLLEKLGYIQGEVSGQEVNKTDVLSYDELSKSAESATDAVGTLRSAISTINDAFAEQAENGSISVDTMLAMVDAGYATALQFDAVTGACTINKEAMFDLVQAKIQNQIADLQLLQNNIQQKLADDGNTARESANGFYDLAKAKLASATAEQITSMKQFNDAQSQILALQNAMKNIQKIGAGTYTTKAPSSSASKAASKSAEKTMEDIQKEWKEYLDKYLAMYKAELDAGLIDFNTFLNKSRSLLDEYYRDGKISAKDYWDSVKNLYENQLSIYDKVLSAVTRRIEKEVDGIQDIIDGLEEQNDALQKQLDEYDSILSVVDEVYQDEIDRLQDEKDLLSEKISQLQDEADAYDLLRRKEEAIYALRRAQEQRTKKVFNGKEFVYTTDNEAIRDAQQTLQDIETEELINNLEREQEALDVEIEKLEEFKGKWAEITNAYDEEINRQLAIALWGKDYENLILQNRIEDIESFKNRYISIQDQINDNQSTIDSLEEKKEIYEALKEQWSDISKAYEQAQEDQYASMVLGAQWESDVLSGRIDVLNNFKNQYIAIQQAITNAALEAARAQANAQSIQASSASSGGGGSSYSGGSSSGNEKVVQLQRFMNQVFGSNLTEDGIMGSKTKEAIKHMQLLIGASQTGVYDKATYDKLRYYVGKTLNKENKELYKLAKSLGIPMYDKGTKNAKKGLAIVAENKPELLEDNNGNVSLVTEPSLIEMEGGETVKGAQETQELLNHNNLVPVKMMELPGINGKILKLSTDEFMNKVANVMPNYSSMIQSAIQMPKYDFAPVNRDNSTSVSIGEIHLHEVNNVDSFANAIIRELPSKISQKLGQ